MARIVEWQLPYTWWTGIEIDANKVIKILLRDENNLIEVNWDNELYTDLQLADGIKPTDEFPIWVTVWKVLSSDWWWVSGLLLNMKTTSWDYARWIYGTDRKLYFDNNVWTYTQVYTSPEVDALFAQLRWQLATVAFTGDYDDLINRPAFFQEQADWDELDSDSPAYIKNKPTIPTVNDGMLTIQRNWAWLWTFSANSSTNTTINIPVPNVINNTTSTSTSDALSANQGKELQDQINNLKAMGKFLSLWDSATWLPISFPEDIPYNYSTWDYYLVENTITLPAGYTQLEYIESDGSQYINTGIKAASDVKTEMMVDRAIPPVAWTVWTPFASMNSSSGQYAFFESTNSWGSKYLALTYWTVTGSEVRNIVTDYQKSVITLDGWVLTYDNWLTLTSPQAWATFSTNNDIWLFARDTGQSNFVGVKMYYCKMWKDGALVRDLVPCKDSNNVIWMYDLVSNTFMTNSWTGSFTGGSVANNYRPDGVQYTGVASTVIETDEVEVWDMYIYDGTVWLLQINHGKSVSFANLAGQPSDNAALATALWNKANLTDVLTKTNTTAYTPNADYNPATKKYVDDNIASATQWAVSDDAYSASWNGVTGIAPSKNAVYDEIENVKWSIYNSTVNFKQNNVTKWSITMNQNTGSDVVLETTIPVTQNGYDALPASKTTDWNLYIIYG